MLDFKIRELKKDITPKEVETTNLEQETNKKDQELRYFNELNDSLGFIVEDLRKK